MALQRSGRPGFRGWRRSIEKGMGMASAVTGTVPVSDTERVHPAFFSLGSVLLIAPLCVVGAIIGTQLIVTLGITTNTSLIGALAGMGLARIPLVAFARYRSVHMQNLAQSAISASTFGAGNALLLPIGIPFVMGRPDLVLPLFAGVFLAMLVDAYLLYRMFDSEVFPTSGAWPPGVAAAEAIKAGDEGGRKLVVLGSGVVVGVAGAWFKIPMSAFGVAFIGNIWALSMFGIGLLTRFYSKFLFDNPAFASLIPKGDINGAYIPHGFMIGAGLVALVQVVVLMLRDDAGGSTVGAAKTTADVRRSMSLGGSAFVVIAVLIALLGGLWSELSLGMVIAFLLYAALAALLHEVIVGLAAMHAGWFPAFAVALITLVIGVLAGFPPVALTLLVGFSAATGPAFADMGYDLKAGYMLRGYGADPAFEREGRKQQLFAAMFAFVIAAVVVLIAYPGYFANNLVAPADRVFAATIKAGASMDVARQLAIWAVPGAILQLLGGPKRQLGVLFATGLLLLVPFAGWAVITGVILRMLWTRFAGVGQRSTMEVFAAGVIAGDALFSFYDLGSKYAAVKK
jgi:uncharacterized oligopeptide transporter (OPT) family protein